MSAVRKTLSSGRSSPSLTTAQPDRICVAEPPRRFLVRRRWVSLSLKSVSAFVGVALFASAAYGVTKLTGESGAGLPTAISNLTVSAVSPPAASNQLYPGGSGDVAMIITNLNAFPVTVRGMDLPTSSIYAAGFTSSSLATAQPGCSSITSEVTWNGSTSAFASYHSLTTPLTVTANGTLAVTMTNGASMASGAPAACANTYFSMPPLVGVNATSGASFVTKGPVTDSWTD
jgi:hypothetical protein